MSSGSPPPLTGPAVPTQNVQAPVQTPSPHVSQQPVTMNVMQPKFRPRPIAYGVAPPRTSAEKSVSLMVYVAIGALVLGVGFHYFRSFKEVYTLATLGMPCETNSKKVAVSLAKQTGIRTPRGYKPYYKATLKMGGVAPQNWYALYPARTKHKRFEKPGRVSMIEMATLGHVEDDTAFLIYTGEDTSSEIGLDADETEVITIGSHDFIAYKTENEFTGYTTYQIALDDVLITATGPQKKFRKKQLKQILHSYARAH